MSELLEPALLTGEGEGPSPSPPPVWVGSERLSTRMAQVSLEGQGEHVTESHAELCYSRVPGGYYLTSLSASLALLSGLGQARPLPLSPSQELQRSLSLWEQRRLPATHSFQVTGPHAVHPAL